MRFGSLYPLPSCSQLDFLSNQSHRVIILSPSLQRSVRYSLQSGQGSKSCCISDARMLTGGASGTGLHVVNTAFRPGKYRLRNPRLPGEIQGNRLNAGQGADLQDDTVHVGRIVFCYSLRVASTMLITIDSSCIAGKSL